MTFAASVTLVSAVPFGCGIGQNAIIPYTASSASAAKTIVSSAMPNAPTGRFPTLVSQARLTS